MALDLSKLINLQRAGSKRTAACPACQLNGNDLRGRNHLVIYDDGRFGCVFDQSDAHSKIIWNLAGGEAGEIDPLLVSAQAPEIKIDETWDLSLLDRLVKDHSYWAGRGISAATVEPFRGGVALTGKFANRYIFPIFDQNESEIIGFSGRALKPHVEMRWKHVGAKSKWLWGGLEEIVDKDRVILVESPGDLLMLREHGVPECLCLFGTVMSQAVLGHLISTNPAHLIVSTNRDIKDHKAGQKAANRIAGVLRTFFNEDRVSVVLPPERDGCKDWGDSTGDEIKAAFGAEPTAPERAAESDSGSDDSDLSADWA